MSLPRSLLLFFFLSLASSAQTIQGNVLNSTTGKPEPGHQVILFTAQGERARTTTNENGAFQIELPEKSDPHSTAVLQVVHNGVEYFQAVESGKSTNVRVYEASSQASAIRGYLSILQFQAKGKMLQVTELHALNNTSNPPITRVSPDNLVLAVADGTQVEPAIVSGPDGGTLKLPLVRIPGQKARYRIDFPLKPGVTKYAISYEVPYEGKLVFRRQAQYPTKRLGVIVPESIRFRSLGPKPFHAVEDQPGTHEQVLDGLDANEAFAFELSGVGELARSLRPLSPGQPTRSTQVRTEVQTLMSAQWPHSGPSGTTASPARARTDVVARQVIVGVGVLVLAGMLIWGMRLRRATRA